MCACSHFPEIEAVSDTKPAAVKTAAARRDLWSSIPPTLLPKTPQFITENRCLESPHLQQNKEMRRRYWSNSKLKTDSNSETVKDAHCFVGKHTKTAASISFLQKKQDPLIHA